LQCCESTAEERSAVNPHATFCGSRRRATAPGDPVGVEPGVMGTLMRHRQTKEAETDRPALTPPASHSYSTVKFNADGPKGLIDRKPPGQPSRLADTHRAALAAIIESGPIPAVHGVVRWRIIDLCQWIFEEFRVSIAKQTMSRELRAMGYRKLSARPRHHAQVEGVIEEYKKSSPRAWMKSRAKRASIRRQ